MLDPEGAPEFAHPLFRAPFVLEGSGGRSVVERILDRDGWSDWVRPAAGP